MNGASQQPSSNQPSPRRLDLHPPREPLPPSPPQRAARGAEGGGRSAPLRAPLLRRLFRSRIPPTHRLQPLILVAMQGYLVIIHCAASILRFLDFETPFFLAKSGSQLLRVWMDCGWIMSSPPGPPPLQPTSPGGEGGPAVGTRAQPRANPRRISRAAGAGVPQHPHPRRHGSLCLVQSYTFKCF